MGICDFGSIFGSHEHPVELEKSHHAQGATECHNSEPKITKMKCRKVDESWHTYFGQHPVDKKTTKVRSAHLHI